MSDLGTLLAVLTGEDDWARHEALENLRHEGAEDAALEGLLQTLKEEDAAHRAAARDALAALADPESPTGESARGRLVEALDHGDTDLRVLAASALGEAGDERAGPALVRALTDPERNVVAAAADALGELGWGLAREPLTELLATPDFWVRAAAIVALGRLRDERAVPALARAAEEPGLERPIAEALRRIGHPDALRALRVVNETAPEESLLAAGAVLCGHPETEPPVWVVEGARRHAASLRVTLVEEDDPVVARLLGLTGDEEELETLVQLLGPPRWSEAAISGLLAAPEDLRAELVLERLPEAEPREVVTLLSLLPPLRDPDRVRALVPFLDHGDASVRGAAAEALARTPPPEALPLLAEELDRRGVAPEVVRALGALGDTACGALLPLLEDAAAEVRLAAARALERCASPGTADRLLDAVASEEEPEIRAVLLRAAARAGGTAALPALDDALDSDRPQLRLAAIEALGEVRDEAAVDRLADVFPGTDAEAVAALRSLGSLGSPAAVPLLVAELETGNLDRRRAAASAALRLSTHLDPATVTDLAGDPDEWIRICAVRILAQRQETRPELERLMERDPSSEVRTEARRALRAE